MIKECCVCQKREQKGQWTRSSSAAVRWGISHVYCPSCFAGFMAKIDRHALRRTKEAYPVTEAGSL